MGRHHNIVIGGAPALLVAALLTAAGPAHAQGYALSQFEPSERGSRFFLADSLELHHPPGDTIRPALAFGLTTSYAYRTRVFGNGDEDGARLVEHAVYFHPGVTAVLAPGARFALDVPVAIQSGETTRLAGKLLGAPASPRFGDVRLGFDLNLLGPAAREREGLAIAAGASVWFPTGSPVDLTGDDGTHVGAHVVAVFHQGSWLGSARVSYIYRRDDHVGTTRVGGQGEVVLGLGWLHGPWTVGPELRGTTLVYDLFSTHTTPVEMLLGAHRDVGLFRFGLAAGSAVVPGLGAPYFRAILSAEWVGVVAEPGSDRDHDGVPDRDDACPDAVGSVHGCPAAPADADGDGVPDDEDACPSLPGARTSDPTTHGCPPMDVGDGPALEP